MPHIHLEIQRQSSGYHFFKCFMWKFVCLFVFVTVCGSFAGVCSPSTMASQGLKPRLVSLCSCCLSQLTGPFEITCKKLLIVRALIKEFPQLPEKT